MAYVFSYMFSLSRIYIEDKHVVPYIQRLQRLLESFNLNIQMVDCSQTRFMDFYCTNLKN